MKHNPLDPIESNSSIDLQRDHTSERDLISVNLPAYSIVGSCKTLGFEKPLDCFWSEITPESEYFLKDQYPCACADYRRIGSRWSGLKASATIQVFVHRCLFNDKDTSVIYRMGQCPACHTIYWSREE